MSNKYHFTGLRPAELKDVYAKYLDQKLFVVDDQLGTGYIKVLSTVAFLLVSTNLTAFSSINT